MRKFTILGLVLGMILTSFGQIGFENTFGGSGYDYGYSVVQTSDGGYVVTGYTESFGGNGEFYLIKTDADGDATWAKTYEGDELDRAASVVQTTDGGYIITGYTNSSVSIDGVGDLNIKSEKQ